MKRIYISYNYIIYVNDTVIIPVTLKDAKYKQNQSGWTVYDQTNASFFVEFTDIVNFYNSESGTAYWDETSFGTFLNSYTALPNGHAIPFNNSDSGWGQYADTAYTSGSPFSLVASIDTKVPNNAGIVIESQLPADITTYYDGVVITGKNGDSAWITIDLKALPTNPSTTYIEIWFDIGGSVGELYRRIITFPKGNGVERPINFTVGVYSLDTWETNGATVYCNANNTCDLYDIRYVISRTHKAV